MTAVTPIRRDCTHFVLAAVIITLLAACRPDEKPAAPATPPSPATVAPGLFATIATDYGEIVVELFADRASETVANFVGLAEGKKPFTDPKTGARVQRPFYNGLTFHRVIPGFMIQGGCPLGNGTGGPGYRFADEVTPELAFDRPGRLAMANAGPGTNGSQFFITVAPTPWLNMRHTIFGQVVSGQDVVERIVSVPRSPDNDMPLRPVVIRSVNIRRVP